MNLRQIAGQFWVVNIRLDGRRGPPRPDRGPFDSREDAQAILDTLRQERFRQRKRRPAKSAPVPTVSERIGSVELVARVAALRAARELPAAEYDLKFGRPDQVA